VNKKLQKLALKATMLVASLAFILTMMVGTASAHSTHIASPKVSKAVNLGSTMYRGGYFDLADGGNDYLSSPWGQYQLKFQPDGNLVEYNSWAGYADPIWASNTTYAQTCAGCGAGYIAKMQTDGNFVIYDVHGTALFATGTYYHYYPQYRMYDSGYKLVVENGSNVVIYDQYGRALWTV
jgi:hypothetical protein